MAWQGSTRDTLGRNANLGCANEGGVKANISSSRIKQRGRIFNSERLWSRGESERE